tara:strand:- start:408 stop:851 length:444 start_codon:yes stop_codon:yes gene_type:complete
MKTDNSKLDFSKIFSAIDLEKLIQCQTHYQQLFTSIGFECTVKCVLSSEKEPKLFYVSTLEAGNETQFFISITLQEFHAKLLLLDKALLDLKNLGLTPTKVFEKNSAEDKGYYAIEEDFLLLTEVAGTIGNTKMNKLTLAHTNNTIH